MNAITWRMSGDQYNRFNKALARQAQRRALTESPPMDPDAYELMLWSWMHTETNAQTGWVDVLALTNERGSIA